MPRSLVARLTLLVALIVGVAFALLATILLRSTSTEFVRTTELVATQASSDAHEVQLLGAAQTALAAFGVPGLQRIADAPESFKLPADIAFLVIDPDFKVLASTEAVLTRANIRNDPSGGLHIALSENGAAGRAELQLSTPPGAELRDSRGMLVGQVLLLPAPLDEDAGDAFARGVWRSAALGLLVVIAISMFLTALTLRWFLQPIDRLTDAAQVLVEGGRPRPMKPSGHVEIDRLISAFNAATAAIVQTENMRRQLISDIAHELRTPITNLKGQLEAAEAGLIDADADLLETLGAEVQLLAELVEDFQQLAVSDAGQLRLTLESLPLKATLEAIILPMAQRIGADCHLAIDAGLHVQADTQRLRQVIGNLVENAHRHRVEGLRLTLTAERAGSRVRLIFADNGPGVAVADQPHVFERFYRAEKSRNRAGGGAGLGLTIAKALVEAMHGEIRLLAGTDAGARFEVELPLGD